VGILGLMLPRRTLYAGSVRRVTHDEIADTIGENVRGSRNTGFPTQMRKREQQPAVKASKREKRWNLR